MPDSSNASTDSGARVVRPASLEFPVEPGYDSRPPEGSAEDGVRLSLEALKLVANRPEIWAERERLRCRVEFTL